MKTRSRVPFSRFLNSGHFVEGICGAQDAYQWGKLFLLCTFLTSRHKCSVLNIANMATGSPFLIQQGGLLALKYSDMVKEIKIKNVSGDIVST